MRRQTRSGSSGGESNAVKVLGEDIAVQAAEILGCEVDPLRCKQGKDGRWYRLSVPEGVAAHFDHSEVSVRANTPAGIVDKLLNHPLRSSAATATG